LELRGLVYIITIPRKKFQGNTPPARDFFKHVINVSQELIPYPATIPRSWPSSPGEGTKPGNGKSAIILKPFATSASIWTTCPLDGEIKSPIDSCFDDPAAMDVLRSSEEEKD
jgi:hypothetical protein